MSDQPQQQQQPQPQQQPDLEKKVEELEKKVDELNAQINKIKDAVKTIAGILDNHLKGKWTLEDVKVAISNINEMVNLLTQSGIIRPGGEGNGNWLQMMLAQQFVNQKHQSESIEVEPIKKKSKKKLKKLLEDEGEDEGEDE